MIRTADLTGAQLDYHTARAQGIPAERLEIRRVPRTDTLICVSLVPVVSVPGYAAQAPMPVAKHYSTDWHLAGALIERHRVDLARGCPRADKVGHWDLPNGFSARTEPAQRLPDESAREAIERVSDTWMPGPTPQVAICRAVVRAAFGDEVEEVAVCE